LTPLRILLLKDRRPGHYRKSEGVAAAIGRRLPIDVSEIAIRARLGLPTRVQRALLRTRRAAPLLLSAVWNIDFQTVSPPDLIVSAGSDTLVPNALLAARFGCRNIFIGDIRGIAPELFSAVLSARPEFAGRDRHLIVLSPSGVDPDALRPPLPIASTDSVDGRTLALLVGGPAPGYQFGTADWEALGPLLREATKAGARFFVTSSRRTPDRIADHLALLAKALPGVVEFIDYRTARPGSIDPLFNADAILVTEDSNTMISEAVAARRPVVVLRPETLKTDMSSLRRLRDEQRVAVLPMRQATLENVVQQIRATRPFEENPMDELYDLLVRTNIIPVGRQARPAQNSNPNASISRR
jgi:mitochondrial fission protein ELM1